MSGGPIVPTAAVPGAEGVGTRAEGVGTRAEGAGARAAGADVGPELGVFSAAAIAIFLPQSTGKGGASAIASRFLILLELDTRRAVFKGAASSATAKASIERGRLPGGVAVRALGFVGVVGNRSAAAAEESLVFCLFSSRSSISWLESRVWELPSFTALSAGGGERGPLNRFPEVSSLSRAEVGDESPSKCR